ncbi:5-(carboxyamino)imidazole ribonucleotide synthase [Mycoplasmatota bacterium]|nr:5-(carboxyamino)imidazole ribonucleotide synthase [Mycoplasmatota bacterium]
MSKVILPGSTIGIIGGGQLGRMLAIAAKQMGYKIAVLEPTKNGPCAQVADLEINASYDDPSALKQLAEKTDVITYEFENIPVKAICNLEKCAYIPQGYRLLEISQNRVIEKTILNEKGFKTVDFEIVSNQEQLKEKIEILKYPCVLKTATGGYDGKGQVVLKNKSDLDKAYTLLTNSCVLEKYMNFKGEISAIVTRSTNGEIKVFPISENIHVNNILSKTIVPARVSAIVEKKAKEIAINFMKTFDFYGTVAIEMFVLENDEILINEIAPRVHNSGHYSIEACFTSQFEEHIRAICGLKLGSTELVQKAVMVNLLGKDLEKVTELLQIANCKVHLYGKTGVKTNRKMGHVTFIGTNQEKIINQVKEIFG